MVTQEDLLEDLVSYFKLDETSGTTANNEVGSNGTANNAAVFTSEITGIINTGADLSGDKKVDIPNSTLNWSNPFTISGWIRMTSNTSNTMEFICNNDGNNANGINMRFTSGDFLIGTGAGSGTVIFYQENGWWSTYSDGWVHVVYTYNGTNAQVYINNDLKKDDSFSPNAHPTALLSIGASRTTITRTNKFLEVDEVGIWDRHSTSEQVSILNNNGEGLSYPFVLPREFPIISESKTFYTADLTRKIEEDDDWNDFEEMEGLEAVDGKLVLEDSETSGFRISKPLSLDELQTFKDSLILWDGEDLDGIRIYTMIKDDDTPPSRESEDWELATNNQPIPEVQEGESAEGKYYFTKIEFDKEGFE